ncbi:MAG TPA: hypothetical protein VF803_03505 [Candidatus Paceibacterota bacterium]
MDIFKNKTVLMGGAALLLIAAALWWWFSGSSTSNQPLQVVTNQGNTAGQSLITALSQLRNVSLDSKIFSDPVFMSLSDFGVTITPQPVGRTDPFAPLTGVASSTSVALPGSIKTGR